MRTLLKILFTGLLLMLAVAVGTEVAALHRSHLPDPSQTVPTVVVRKAAHASTSLKMVRPLTGHKREQPPRPKVNPVPRPKAPAS